MAGFDMHRREVWEQLAPESKYRVRDLAARAGISRTQLKRFFNELFHAAPQRVLIGWRREDSLELVEQAHPLKDLTDALGYKQRSHFSREFKEYSGVSLKTFKSLPEQDREYLKMALQSPASHRRCQIVLQILARKN